MSFRCVFVLDVFSIISIFKIFHSLERIELKKFLSDLHEWGLKMKMNILPTKLRSHFWKFVFQIISRWGEGKFLAKKCKNSKFLIFFTDQNEFENFESVTLFLCALGRSEQKNGKNCSEIFEIYSFENWSKKSIFSI